jgi:enoyl-CoA hydratase/carnithine racemase
MKFFSVAEPIAKIDRPVIAAIQGDALGQGLEMALACDLRVAAETSRFGLPQIHTGLIPWNGGTQRLTRLVGRGKALEMILTGETIDAREAYQVGLVNKVVPPKELMSTVTGMAREMASKGSIALRYTKEAVYQGMDLTLEQGLRLEADLYLLIHTTKDRTEGIKAFREKRVPKFEGK